MREYKILIHLFFIYFQFIQSECFLDKTQSNLFCHTKSGTEIRCMNFDDDDLLKWKTYGELKRKYVSKIGKPSLFLFYNFEK